MIVIVLREEDAFGLALRRVTGKELINDYGESKAA